MKARIPQDRIRIPKSGSRPAVPFTQAYFGSNEAQSPGFPRHVWEAR